MTILIIVNKQTTVITDLITDQSSWEKLKIPAG